MHTCFGHISEFVPQMMRRPCQGKAGVISRDLTPTISIHSLYDTEEKGQEVPMPSKISRQRYLKKSIIYLFFNY